MKFVSGLYTDVGIRKKTNQDSMLLLHAMTEYGEAVFAVVCDGMGGLAKGEVASADVILALSDWFKNSFQTVVLPGGAINESRLQQAWSDLIDERADAISRYGTINSIALGTTLTCVLLFSGKYYVANVGDSRVYVIRDKTYQITHDHTVVQQKIDNGLITEQQAATDPQRSVLLQCIGASDMVKPDFFMGEIQPNDVFLLCCDGFRHMITPEELQLNLNPQRLGSTSQIESALKSITDMLKIRRESDNISAVVVQTI